MVVCNDDVVVNVSGNVISTSNGESYSLAGLVLVKDGQTVSMNVSSISAAVNIVVGMHGGRKF